MFPPQDEKRYERLRTLSPIEAVQAFLDGSFGIGDEPALIEAIQRDRRVMMSGKEITDVIFEAMDEDLDAEATLERIAHRG